MKTNILICLLGLFVQTLHAQTLVRQESSNQIKKVVYTGNASQFPQTNGSSGVYYAIVPVPEINLTNMPSVTVLISPMGSYNQTPSGWYPVDYGTYDNVSVAFTNGICYLGWSEPGAFVNSLSALIDNAVFTNFMIIVVYEDNSATQQISSTNQINAALGNSGTNVNSTTEINLNFATQPKALYYIQSSQNLTSWTNFDGPFLGNGNAFLKTYPTTNQSKQFFRFSATPIESW